MKTATTTSTLRALAHAGNVPDPEMPEKAKRRQFSAQYKLDVLAEYDRLSEPGAKGALLRREGLYSSHLGDDLLGLFCRLELSSSVRECSPETSVTCTPAAAAKRRMRRSGSVRPRACALEQGG